MVRTNALALAKVTDGLAVLGLPEVPTVGAGGLAVLGAVRTGGSARVVEGLASGLQLAVLGDGSLDVVGALEDLTGGEVATLDQIGDLIVISGAGTTSTSDALVGSLVDGLGHLVHRSLVILGGLPAEPLRGGVVGVLAKLPGGGSRRRPSCP